MRGGGPLLTSRGLSKEEEYLLPIEALGRMRQPTKLLLLEVSRCHSLLVGQPSLPLHSLCSHLLSRRLGTLGFGGSLAHHHQVVWHKQRSCQGEALAGYFISHSSIYAGAVALPRLCSPAELRSWMLTARQGPLPSLFLPPAAPST